MRKAYIVAGKRTAIGKFLGSLSTVKPGEMTAQVMKAVLEQTNTDPARIDEVFVAHQHSAGRAPPLPAGRSWRPASPPRSRPPRSTCSAAAA